ncbi:MAG: TetR/AcrR family transcriptional regulator, partial [Gammaproteobacteria bacterium]|nr:TetR/AcrR family transcriptional regulator [Gammaproteobacteria bacterium]
FWVFQMGRSKIVDESAALDRAMRLFWHQGYANTSIKQLLTEMDMLNGSFYHSFKDKKTVFLKSLQHYNEEVTSKRQAALASHDNFSLGIRALFAEIFRTLASKNEPNGCLIVNSMEDEVLRIEELKELLNESFDLFIQFLTDRAQRSIDMELTSNDLPARQLAFIIATYIQGLFRVSNINVNIKQLKSQTDDFLSALKL